jgi:hypothetical protein
MTVVMFEKWEASTYDDLNNVVSYLRYPCPERTRLMMRLVCVCYQAELGQYVNRFRRDSVMPNNKSNISHWRTRTRPLINEIKKFDGPGATGTVTNMSTTTSYLLQSAASQGDINDAYLQTLQSSLSEFVKKDRDGQIVSRILDFLEHAVLPEGHPSNPEDILFDNLIYQINKRLYAVFKDVQYRLDRIHDLPVILYDSRSLTDAARSLSTWTSNWLRVQETLSEVFGTLASVSDSSNIVTTVDDGLKARDSPFAENPQQKKVSNSSHN